MRALAFLIILVACGAPPAKPTTPPNQPTTPNTPTTPTNSNEEKFSGTITEINFGCAADARCDLTVDGARRVHFGHDTRREGPTTWGNTEEIYTLMGTPKEGVGRKIEVFAAKQGEGQYTLQGKAEYYIKVLPQ